MWTKLMSPSLETAREYKFYEPTDESRLLARMCDELVDLIGEYRLRGNVEHGQRGRPVSGD